MNARAYYNEIDPFAAEWLRSLMRDGLITEGEIDTRSIVDVRAEDLTGFTRCHFFAGIGGWDYALQLAGWPDDRSVWTGSCPCQPFSLAGARQGFDDSRHLWPQFARLIKDASPATVFGEQVASATDWLGLVRGDLETLGYAVGAIPMEAACAGSYQLRDRFWFVASDDEQCAGQERIQRGGQLSRPGCVTENLARLMAGGDSGLCLGWPEIEVRAPQKRIAFDGLGGGHFRVAECADGKWRPIPPPGVRWLGNGIPSRVAKLRALGNAIDPRPASEFIKAFLETEGGI